MNYIWFYFQFKINKLKFKIDCNDLIMIDYEYNQYFLNYVILIYIYIWYNMIYNITITQFIHIS